MRARISKLTDSYAALSIIRALLYAKCYGQLLLYVLAEGLENKVYAMIRQLYTFCLRRISFTVIPQICIFAT